MKQPWEFYDCADVRAYHTHYPIPVAAALWCGVPPRQVDDILKQCMQVGRAIYAHSTVPCIEPRCRAMHEAIEAGDLECRRDGRCVSPEDHVAPERRTVSREALKAWIARAFPASKPPFLFDEVERNTHSAINADSYRVLKAAHDAKETLLEQANERLRNLAEEKGEMESKLLALRSIVERSNAPSERAETTYLNIIGAQLGFLLGKSPGGRPYSVFESQAAVISALLGSYPDRAGIAARTLEEKFAQAKREPGLFLNTAPAVWGTAPAVHLAFNRTIDVSAFPTGADNGSPATARRTSNPFDPSASRGQSQHRLFRAARSIFAWEGTFPKPVSLGGRAVGWLEAEIQDWLQRRIEASRKAAA